MSTEIIHQITEEEWEFKSKNAELSGLEIDLAQQELELATFRGEVHSFRARYLAVVGSRYWELDKIEAEVAEYEAKQKPNDRIAQEKAAHARAQAKESAKSADKAGSKAGSGRSKTLRDTVKFKPTESLKKIYRQIAKQIHPDLALDEQQQARYQKLMAKANQAYEAGDEVGLQNILRQCRKSSSQEKNDNIQDKLARIIRQISQVKERFTAIAREIAEIRNSSLYQLKLKVETADRNGFDLLSEMASFLDEQIELAKLKLAQIKAKGNETGVS
ncbi:MAG TPA: molecular chaperone DnaJ [Firmicutes bacterium]|jgi:hypothetical protein|nr:molecular chaperone DnaJ [Bacillota bacterium]